MCRRTATNLPEHSTLGCVNKNPCGFDCVDGFRPGISYGQPIYLCLLRVHRDLKRHLGGSRRVRQPSVKKPWVGSGSCTEKVPDWAAYGVFGGGVLGWGVRQYCSRSGELVKLVKLRVFPFTGRVGMSPIFFSHLTWLTWHWVRKLF
jgi:hypothetical protein